MEILIIIFFIVLFTLNKNDENNESVEDDNSNWRKDIYEKQQEDLEHFYHPVTGYKGTKSEMDTYIINRERKLNK